MAPANRNVTILFAARCVRLFAYGFLSVVLVLYLAEVGLRERDIGILLTLTLAGDAAVSLWMTASADRVGRRRMLMLGAALMAGAGAVFAATGNIWVLVATAVVGVISPSGGEIGPFLPVEQASLAQIVGADTTRVFAWYNLAGSFATALGALAGGALAQGAQSAGASPLAAYRLVLAGYAACGVLMVVLFRRLSSAVETRTPAAAGPRRLGLHRSRRRVAMLSALFALDSFAGGFVIQSLLAYWLVLKFGVREGAIGGVFFGANLLAGVSALLASRLAARVGLVNTMVFTHLPSNILLCLVPFMPTFWWAVGLLWVRFSISQMDVPTRQAFTMAVVAPDERSAAAGVTNIARSAGAAVAPALGAALLAVPSLIAAPFLIAGGLKIAYDLLLYRAFRTVEPWVREEA